MAPQQSQMTHALVALLTMLCKLKYQEAPSQGTAQRLEVRCHRRRTLESPNQDPWRHAIAGDQLLPSVALVRLTSTWPAWRPSSSS